MLHPLAYRSYAIHISMMANVGLHDFEGMLPLPAIPPPIYIASEKPILGYQGIMATRVTSGVLVGPLSNNGAACYDSSSSLMKHWSFMFASSWCDN